RGAALGNDPQMASVPGEVCYAGEWYDYETKYGEGQTTLKVPAPLPPATTELIRTLAVKAFQAVDCAGMARVDFFVETGGRVLVNEINTIPGFTQTSAYPRLWEASGIPYPELIARLIELALERRRWSRARSRQARRVRVVIAGGGTGGHTSAGLAVSAALLERGADLHW